ncbi:MAG TPA: carbohydrate porin, partial [Candidatus Methylacidiphilales bacterium]
MRIERNTKGALACLLAGILPGISLAGTETVSATPDPKAVTIMRQDLMNQTYLTGDWGGVRSAWAKQGITLNLDHYSNMQTDVSGGQTHHVDYFGRFRLTADVNLQKLADYDGEFFFTGVYQYGRNLTSRLNVNTLVSPIAGEEFLGVDELWYQQGFADSRVKLKVGQIAAVNEFGATDFGDVFLSDELSYAPNAIFQSAQPFSPPGKPGVVLKGDLRDVTPGLYAKFGAFTAIDNAYRPDRNGVDYGDDFNHAASIAGEFGYLEQKTDYAGTYKVGFNATDRGHYYDQSTGAPVSGDYTVYGLIEKSVYHPTVKGKLDTARGLDLLGEGVYAPGDRNFLQYEGTLGARYTGLLDSRPKDKIGLGLIYSQAGDHASNAYAAANGGHLGGETTVELSYVYHVTDW